MKRTFLLFIILLSCLSCKDKRANLSDSDLWIDYPEWHWGNVTDDAELFHSFEIYNPTLQSCTITNIIASCGCTSYQIHDSIIKPKHTTMLDVKLNPKGLKGEFIRDIYLFTSLREKPYELYLSANIPLTKDEIKHRYRIKLCDKIYSNISSIYIGNVYQNKIITREIELVNTSDKSYPLKCELMGKQNYISIVAPDSLHPFKPEKVTVIYDGNKNESNIWGLDSSKVILKCLNQKRIIDCNAIMVPFPLVKSPKRIRMFVQKDILSSANKIKVRLKNVGNDNLRIYKIRTSDNIDVIKYDSIILPQEEKFMICKYKDNLGNKIVEILTNDDTNPVLKLEL